LALARATNSSTDFAGEELGTTMMFDWVQINVTGAKSATGS
jgi:hypothetical protein